MRFGQKPCISVVIPAFNRSRCIGTAIESVLQQTFNDWELLIIDDGSADNTMQVVDPYLLQHPGVRYMKHSNRKAPISRNAGIQASFGKFITFLDTDDHYLPNHLASRMAIMAEPSPPDLLVGGILAQPGTMVRDRHNPELLVPLEQCIPSATFFGKRELFFLWKGSVIYRMLKIPTFGNGPLPPDGNSKQCNTQKPMSISSLPTASPETT